MYFLCELEDKVIFFGEGGKQENVWRLEESENTWKKVIQGLREWTLQGNVGGLSTGRVHLRLIFMNLY